MHLGTSVLASFVRRVCLCATVCVFVNHVFLIPSPSYWLLVLFILCISYCRSFFAALLLIHWKSNSVPNTISLRKISDDLDSLCSDFVLMQIVSAIQIHVQLLDQFHARTRFCTFYFCSHHRSLRCFGDLPIFVCAQMQMVKFFNVLFRIEHCVWLFNLEFLARNNCSYSVHFNASLPLVRPILRARRESRTNFGNSKKKTISILVHV